MTADPANAKRVERFKALIRVTAKRVSCKRDDPRVRRWVALELSAEQVMARMVAGRDFDPGLLLKIQEAQASIFPMASVQVDPLNIQIVRRLHEPCRACGESQPFVCQSCGYEETVDNDANKRPPARIIAKPEEASSEPSAPPPDNVFPIRRSNAPLATHTEPSRRPPGA